MTATIEEIEKASRNVLEIHILIQDRATRRRNDRTEICLGVTGTIVDPKSPNGEAWYRFSAADIRSEILRSRFMVSGQKLTDWLSFDRNGEWLDVRGMVGDTVFPHRI